MVITETEADQAYSALVEHADAIDRDGERHAFVHAVSKADRPTDEYRFMGSLGFGGKFRNPGHGSVPYVDCYPEDMTSERSIVIDRTNEALAALFQPKSDPSP